MLYKKAWRFKIPGVAEIVVTDEPLVVIDEYGEEIDITEEGGAWAKGVVYVYRPALEKWYQRWGTGVHEFVEMILESKLGAKHPVAHTIANVLETVLSLGLSKAVWYSWDELKTLMKYKVKNIFELPASELYRLFDIEDMWNGEYTKEDLERAYKKFIEGGYGDTEKIEAIRDYLDRYKEGSMSNVRNGNNLLVYSEIINMNDIMIDGINIWFTSDTHFGQERTLLLSKRPYRTVHEMNDDLVRKWNNVVGHNDIVFHLGDFGQWEFLDRLNGFVILVAGNYDSEEELSPPVGHNKLLYVVDCGQSLLLDIGGLVFELVHEPGNYTGTGDFCLFGHVHKQAFKRNGLNVGVDCHWGMPVDLNTVMHFVNAVVNYYDNEVFSECAGK